MGFGAVSSNSDHSILIVVLGLVDVSGSHTSSLGFQQRGDGECGGVCYTEAPDFFNTN